MGKASRRKKSKTIPNSPFYQQMAGTVPVDTWRACIKVYESAARLVMPTTNPEQYKVSVEGKVYAFCDNEMNRGMFAVKKFLAPQQVELFPAVSARIMALAMLKQFRSDTSFQEFFQEDTADGALMVSEALTDAFASANFIPGTMDLDRSSLLAIASRLLKEES